MHCHRCDGLMVSAGTIWDAAVHAPDDDLPALWETGDRQVSRCVNCGYVSDPIIEHNRRTPMVLYGTPPTASTRQVPRQMTRVEPGVPEARCAGALALVTAQELGVIWQGGD